MERRLIARQAATPTPIAPVTVAMTVQAQEVAVSAPASEAVEPDAAVPAAETPAADERAPWPDDAAESAYLADAREQGVPSAPGAPEKADPAEEEALPPMQSLVERIPAPARETLEDLFRARFVAVRRVPPSVLK